MRSEIEEDEPESLDYPAAPIPFSYVEWYLPSNSALLRFLIMGLVGFSAYSLYFFFFSWKGSLMWKWLKWRYEFDDYTMTELSKYAKVPFYKPKSCN